MVPLNVSEIAILGGVDDNDFYLSDVVVLNVTNNTYRKVAEGGDYKFWSASNQIALVGNKVIAQVNDDEQTPSLIKWTFRQDSVTVLHEYPSY